jgi:membrane-associated HD superfamily phosphohydrolase
LDLALQPMAEILFSLPALFPLACVVAALVFSRRSSFRAQTIWSGVAIAISLPLGLVVLFAPQYNPTYEHNPGVGVAAIPLIFGWAVCTIAWFVGVGFGFARRIARRSRT